MCEWVVSRSLGANDECSSRLRRWPDLHLLQHVKWRNLVRMGQENILPFLLFGIYLSMQTYKYYILHDV